jgi:very-short-patch-repair endonuclease
MNLGVGIAGKFCRVKGQTAEGGARLHPSPLEKVAEGRMRSLSTGHKFKYHSSMKPTPLTFARAKRMRREPTAAERKLWGALRNRSLGGYKFYRQVPVGLYIVDFINHEFCVVIEVDGATHGDADEIAYHERRSAYLKSKGLFVHRIGNLDVFENMHGVCDGILIVMAERGG